jgi:hypothetical protein
MINEDWYRLGSYQARFAAAEMVSSEALAIHIYIYITLSL